MTLRAHMADSDCDMFDDARSLDAAGSPAAAIRSPGDDMRRDRRSLIASRRLMKRAIKWHRMDYRRLKTKATVRVMQICEKCRQRWINFALGKFNACVSTLYLQSELGLIGYTCGRRNYLQIRMKLMQRMMDIGLNELRPCRHKKTST
jgi:hypothetical protein